MAYFNIKRKKYGNVKVEYDNIKFDSKRERDRYIYLKNLQNEGIISNLELQVKYTLIPPIKEKYIKHLKTKDVEKEHTLQLAITYTCDFRYVKDGIEIVEDVKASPSLRAIDKTYLLKKKLMFYIYKIKIKEIYKHNEPIV